MRKRYGLLAVAGGALLAIALAFSLSREREPVYQGRDLSEWVRLWGGNHEDSSARSQARVALIILGTNNLDLLISRLSFEPKSSMIARLALSLPNGRARTGLLDSLGRRLVTKDRLAQDAEATFYVMGPAGTPAIPRLVKLVNSGGEVTPLRALNALEGIGEPAFPAISAIISNCTTHLRLQALYRLQPHTDSPIARAVLTNALQNPDPRIRAEAASILNREAFE